MSLSEYKISTAKRGMYMITRQVQEAVQEAGIKEGLAVVFSPHTTAGITINENADPDVMDDVLRGLDKSFPNLPTFKHGEGNSDAHLKASCLGVSETVIVTGGRLLLGIWQGIYFCEFDGPRERKYFVKVLPG